jgi:hypothetical protein
VTRRSFRRTGVRSAVVSTRDDKRHLAKSPANPFAAGALTTETGVIDLDPASKALGRVAFKHDLLQLVFDF